MEKLTIITKPDEYRGEMSLEELDWNIYKIDKLVSKEDDFPLVFNVIKRRDSSNKIVDLYKVWYGNSGQSHKKAASKIYPIENVSIINIHGEVL